MKKFKEYLDESLSTMEIYKANDGKWYVGNKGRPGYVGPFNSIDDMIGPKGVFVSKDIMKKVSIDASGKRQAPENKPATNTTSKKIVGPNIRRQQRGMAFFDLP